ncbi:glycoside hydrolase family 125 protein [Cohnella sp. NL03-T5]|uniref:Glycoside hydrolase family 125 protein n=2 Tax=Cohnella silvisoli TaxID=2873699 RepID=A0ABV1KSL1_9BACL|nr:glycoside hydrolase family 125 protein [Cohnella silvisoli]
MEQVAKQAESIDPELARMFLNCYPNTLETTVQMLEDDTTFVITGDIPAMWLRDSSAQIRPYVHLAKEDEKLRRLIRGLIQRQVNYLLLDPYANAFNKDSNSNGHQTDLTVMGPWIWERKFELDSMCYPIQLCHDYWSATGDQAVFTDELHQMLSTVIRTMIVEQRHDVLSPYYFEREREKQTLPSDTLPFEGRGTRTNYTGMVWSGFRPSDDACKYGYLIPANMFAVVVLKYAAEIARSIYGDEELAQQAEKLQQEIEFGIENYGIYRHPELGDIYAYETDGYGNYNLMDDANVPSLLSIPYLGYRGTDDPLYQRTRAFVLSTANPYYFAGHYAQGIGSPHTPRGFIWHIGLIMQGLTSTDSSEQAEIINALIQTTAGTGFMHESFHCDDPERYTRKWFAWANSLFGQFVAGWLKTRAPLSETVI